MSKGVPTFQIGEIEVHYREDGSVWVSFKTAAGAPTRPVRFARSFEKGDKLTISFGKKDGRLGIRDLMG